MVFHRENGVNRALLKIVSLFFSIIFLIFMFNGCGNKNGNEGVSSGDGSQTNETSIYLDSLPEKMDLKGRTIRFVCDTTIGNMTERSILCDEPSGDIVNASIYKRNNNINERFNVNFEIVKTAKPDAVADVVRQSVLTGSDDYDIVAGYQFYTVRLATEGLMLNLNNLPNLDFTQEYWSQKMLEGMTYKDATYWCTGDIALRYIGGVYVTFINKTIWENYFPDEDYYQVALDGEWTIDKLNEMSKQVYEDVNMNDEKDSEDLVGLLLNIHDDIGEGLYMGCNITFSDVDESGVPYLKYDLEKIIGYCEKATELTYRNNGALQAGMEIDEVMQQFAQGTVMATMSRLYMSEIHLRNMKDDFAVLPMPKYDTDQEEYITGLHDGTTIYGIPVTNTCLDETTMVLEAMAAESYRVVTPVWYDIALKIKYTRDSMSGQMIDMIRQGIIGDFAFYYHIGNISHELRSIINGETSYMSSITSVEPTWQADMDDVLMNISKYSD